MTRTDHRQIAVVGAIGAALALTIVVGLAMRDQQRIPRQVEAYATPYDMRILDDPLESLIARSDGQAFATLARDPLLRRATEELRTPGHAAYRAQRPLLPYLAWGTSLGRSGWVPPALALIAVASTGLGAAACGALLSHRGRSPLPAALVLLLPGFHSSLAYFGPEPLGFALGSWGVVAWEQRRRGWAVVLFALAGLARESMLLVPGALLLYEVLAGRARRAAPLVVTPLPYVAWVAFLSWRLGGLPTEFGNGALAMPFRGVFAGLQHSLLPGGHLWAVAFLLVAIWALVVAHRDHLAWISLAYVAFGLVMGELVWQSWEYFARVLLPGTAFAIVAILGTRGSEADGTSHSHRSAAPLAAQQE